jgi:hypothetical protein
MSPKLENVKKVTSNPSAQGRGKQMAKIHKTTGRVGGPSFLTAKIYERVSYNTTGYLSNESL